MAWDWNTLNVHDQCFNPLVQPFSGQTSVLADEGFRDKDSIPENMKICKEGTWNERMTPLKKNHFPGAKATIYGVEITTKVAYVAAKRFNHDLFSVHSRMCLETAFSLLTVVCGLKKIRHRLARYIQSRLALISAMFNVLLDLFHSLRPDAMPHPMSIAEFAL